MHWTSFIGGRFDSERAPPAAINRGDYFGGLLGNGPIGPPEPRSGNSLIPAACRIASTSRMSAVAVESFGGQVKSGDRQPCHVTCVELPKEALLTHVAAGAFALRAAARSAKNRAAVAAESVNGFAALGEPPRACSAAEPFPFDDTSMV